MAFEQGPYIQAATFCSEVIEDKYGVLSLIRLIDTLTHTEGGSDPPEEMPPTTFQMKLVIMLKPGTARGRHEVKIIPEKPSGESAPPMAVTVHLEGEERGQNILSPVTFTFTMEGLYYFNVYFDEKIFTRLPFRVKYNRIITGPSLKQP